MISYCRHPVGFGSSLAAETARQAGAHKSWLHNCQALVPRGKQESRLQPSPPPSPPPLVPPPHPSKPWKSYKKSARQHGSAEARANVDVIKLRPPDFPALLTDEVRPPALSFLSRFDAALRQPPRSSSLCCSCFFSSPIRMARGGAEYLRSSCLPYMTEYTTTPGPIFKARFLRKSMIPISKGKFSDSSRRDLFFQSLSFSGLAPFPSLLAVEYFSFENRPRGCGILHEIRYSEGPI